MSLLFRPSLINFRNGGEQSESSRIVRRLVEFRREAVVRPCTVVTAGARQPKFRPLFRCARRLETARVRAHRASTTPIARLSFKARVAATAYTQYGTGRVTTENGAFFFERGKRTRVPTRSDTRRRDALRRPSRFTARRAESIRPANLAVLARGKEREKRLCGSFPSISRTYCDETR